MKSAWLMSAAFVLSGCGPLLARAQLEQVQSCSGPECTQLVEGENGKRVRVYAAGGCTHDCSQLKFEVVHENARVVGMVIGLAAGAAVGAGVGAGVGHAAHDTSYGILLGVPLGAVVGQIIGAIVPSYVKTP